MSVWLVLLYVLWALRRAVASHDADGLVAVLVLVAEVKLEAISGHQLVAAG